MIAAPRAMNRLLAVLLLSLGLQAAAQPAPEYARTVSLAVTSGTHLGAPTADSAAAGGARLAFETTVRVPDARWLRLHFAQARLGEGSFLRITSLKDGGQQRLSAQALAEWRLGTATFNGDAVTVALIVAADDDGASFELAEAEAGLPPPDNVTICGSIDDRTASTDAAVGRMRNGGGFCTGWLASNGTFLAAGHCASLTNLEFNVPLSDATGSANAPDPDDQYAVNALRYEAVPDPNYPGDTIPGQDWMVFSVARNPNTGLLPAQAQGAFYRVTQDSNPLNFRITGFGDDSGTARFTQQTHTGTNEGETVNDANWVLWQYRVDTQGGNSGSPVSLTDQALAVGIHTHGGCASSGGANQGVSFESDDLALALDDFFGTEVVHLDAAHPASLQSGTPLRPYKTVASAMSNVPSGGTVLAVTGTYVVGPTVYTKGMTWEAPVGSVVLR